MVKKKKRKKNFISKLNFRLFYKNVQCCKTKFKKKKKKKKKKILEIVKIKKIKK